MDKASTRFKVYERVRIGEIQAATEGDVMLVVDVGKEKHSGLVDARSLTS